MGAVALELIHDLVSCTPPAEHPWVITQEILSNQSDTKTGVYSALQIHVEQNKRFIE